MRVVVSDAGPLICLGRLDLIRLLPALFAEVQVPDPVLLECTSRWQSPDAARINTAVSLGWVTACGPQQMIEGPLGRGERAAIARALAIGAGLLTDDQDARARRDFAHRGRRYAGCPDPQQACSTGARSGATD